MQKLIDWDDIRGTRDDYLDEDDVLRKGFPKRPGIIIHDPEVARA